MQVRGLLPCFVLFGKEQTTYHWRQMPSILKITHYILKLHIGHILNLQIRWTCIYCSHGNVCTL